MTFQVTTKDAVTGRPVGGILIMANVVQRGLTYQRSSDGGGYSDLALIDVTHQIHVGDDVVLSVIKDGYQTFVNYYKVTATDQAVSIPLIPFDQRLPFTPFRGAINIPRALPGIPYGDGQRIWGPAFGCYSGTDWQSRIIDALHARNYDWLEYQVSGWPYHRDYPELALDVDRIVGDLRRLHRAGLRVALAFRDDIGPNLAYLRPLAEATQDLVDAIWGIYECNGVFHDNEDVIADVLLQARQLWPTAVNGFHSTSQDNGGHGFGEFPFWQRVAPFTDVYLLQQSAWSHTFADTLDRAMDFVSRLQYGKAGWPVLNKGVVLAEESTTMTYNGPWTEAEGCAWIDRMMTEATYTPAGFFDGGTIAPS